MLSQGGDVSFYARDKTAQAIKTNGIKRIGLFNHYEFTPDKFEVYTDYDEMPKNKFDFVLIASKTTANDDISKYFSKDKVFCARVITGFTRPERHISEITVHTQPILLGSLQKTDDNKTISSKPVAVVSKMINDSEIFNVMKAANYKTNWETPEEYQKIFYSKLIPDTYNHRSSTLQDIKKKQKTEIDTLN
ncbi:hypothetical protein LY90DRAFT_707447, partial [Neocallimastix californiae]